MEENGSYSWVPPKPKKEKKLPDFKRFGKTALVFILFAVLVLGATMASEITPKRKNRYF